MEDTLGGAYKRVATFYRGLNPCFNGRYSRRDSEGLTKITPGLVLILVLMEDTLGEFKEFVEMEYSSLNPCFNGRYSRR